MKLFPLVFLMGITFISCTNNKKEEIIDNRIALRADTVNILKLTDTAVIFEGTCRGCAFENSTSFKIYDSLSLIKLLSIKTIDNNPPDMDGGNISKEVELVPLQTGNTTIKVYKIFGQETEKEDTMHATLYKIKITN
ncbi:MAG: hypothetical protein IT251_10220 [Chitinophagaceae bacterium]|nr:hypothetical protein [Chitinophagaceae bacterium]